MEKIQIKAFDRRRNQNIWVHFCYIADDIWTAYQNAFGKVNMDSQVKTWLKEEFDFEIATIEDVYKAKDLIKQVYATTYPDVYLHTEGDRQGWTRVWLTGKINNMLRR